MKKRTYIQPKVDTMVAPKDALMDPIVLAASSSGPGVGGSLAPSWRPKNPTRTPVF